MDFAFHSYCGSDSLLVNKNAQEMAINMHTLNWVNFNYHSVFDQPWTILEVFKYTRSVVNLKEKDTTANNLVLNYSKLKYLTWNLRLQADN